ncbi:MAG: DUF4114 domain-containing protein [Ginsengibacter sp.]
MKVCNLTLLLFVILLSLASCKKDNSVTKPVKFTSTTYKTLGTYDAAGIPTYATTPDVISSDLLSFIYNTLPERTDLRVSNPELLTTKAIADIKITRSSEAFITFVSSGTGRTNSFGFYTYPTNQPPATTKDINTITYIFPYCGNRTTLKDGTKVDIGRFEAGTSIGFVLLQNGWDTTNHKLNNNVVHFLSNDILNPEVDPNLKKHAVLINYAPENKVLIGFEDIDRTSSDCDHDFNDLIVYCTLTPF